MKKAKDKAAMRVRLLVPHLKNCGGMDSVRDGKWATLWYFTGISLHRDAVGGERSTLHRWLELRCIDIDCPGCAIVRAVELETAVYEALKK